jgi:hypothetical protein
MWKYVCLAALIATTLANTEKAIFLGPKTINIPATHPNLEDLRIRTLTPSNPAVRTHVNAQFPNATAKFGKATWAILDQLTEGKRYELRVCWAATVSHGSLSLKFLMCALQLSTQLTVLSNLQRFSSTRMS